MYKLIIKPFFFLFSAERAHYLATTLLKWSAIIPGLRHIVKLMYGSKTTQAVQLAGISFPNRIGLAAGFDKDGNYLKALSLLSFGHIELGTVTPRPQVGNPKPRLFRLPKDRAIINRMGFNNDGVAALVLRLKQFDNQGNIVIGGNIGKNKDTDLEQAADDYVYCFEILFDHVDYFTINVSSPNTPGLRSLQEREPLEFLLGTLALANEMKDKPKPLFLKIAPDLSFDQLDEIIEICASNKIAGIIATNTTIDRVGLHTSADQVKAIGKGGLSGEPLFIKSTAIISYIRNKMPRPFVIIGVGGIQSSEDAQKKLNAGADLIQVYSGMIYQGPKLINNILINIAIH